MKWSGRLFRQSAPILLSSSALIPNTLASVQRKIHEYIENGAQLGWLVDPIQKRVHIYRPGTSVEVLDKPDTVSGEPLLSGFELNLREIW